MKLKVFSLLIIFISISYPLIAQYDFSGYVRESDTYNALKDAEIYIEEVNFKEITNTNGNFVFKDLKKAEYTVTIFALGYNTIKKKVRLVSDTSLTFLLDPFGGNLDEVVINQQKEEKFALDWLNPVEGTSIYAGKKSEVILMDQMVGNLAANNARQIYSRVVGLNIYDNGDAGLQLNVGGRGLDPNRTANLNTRQNG
ncbi:MAG: carboxypeptidase-like regulatory domain-containing protein, partial [Cytophagales bacterium]